MAEILLKITEMEQSGDPLLDVKRLGRGHAICTMPDGHPWSEAERTHPEWRIVRIPGVAAEAFNALIAPDLGYGSVEARLRNRMLRARQWRVDIEALDTLLADAAIRSEVLSNPAAALRHARKCIVASHPAPPDPDELGRPTLQPDELG